MRPEHCKLLLPPALDTCARYYQELSLLVFYLSQKLNCGNVQNVLADFAKLIYKI